MLKKDYIIALDQGTTSSRAILFNRKKEIVAMSSMEIRQIYPQPGYIEHDPMELFESSVRIIREVMDKAGVASTQVAAIGITNQRETTIVFDRRTGMPVHNAIVWQCRRTAEHCRRLKERGLEDYVRENTGLLLDPYFSGTKIAWILDNVPGARAQAEAGNLLFGTVDSWLLYNLTGGLVHATDHTNASRTMLYNIRNMEWDSRLCAELKVPMGMLPEVWESSGTFGCTGLFGDEIPILAIAGDQQSALFGQGCISKGDVKNTYGTGLFMLVNTGEKLVISRKGLISTIGISYGGQISYAMEGSVFIAGALLKWLRDELGLFRSNDEIEELAEAAGSSLGVTIVPAFSGLGAPYWDTEARGAIFGLTRGAGAGHLIRAALEAIAFQARDLMEIIREENDIEFKSLKVDGGASVNKLMLDFQSALLDLEIIRPVCVESTALGVFYLAGLEAGFFRDAREIFQDEAVEYRVRKEIDPLEKERLLGNWKKSVEAVRFWASR